MCEYCVCEEANVALLQHNEEAFGEKNSLYMDAYIRRSGKPRISVGVCLFGRDIMCTRIPIRYCPMCGRKL